LYRDVYVDAELPLTHGLAIAGAALIVPGTAVFGGRSAAYLLGAESLVDATMPVEVIVPEHDRFGPVAGLRIRRASLTGPDVRSVRRYYCTTPTRTALDIAGAEELPESVVALDVLLRHGLVRAGDLRDAAAALSPGRGTRRARIAVACADERAESPQESRLRVLLLTSGLAPVPQYVVRDADGRFVARVDLAFPDQRVAVEYDGAWHGRPGQLAGDRRRLNALIAAGWTVLHVTAADMYDTVTLVGAVRSLLADRERGVVALSAMTERAVSPRSPGIRGTARRS
jgi:very-short-patch-repair endonuclease